MFESWLSAVFLGFLGLLLGSFLNVVIYRLPVMLHRIWLKESIGFLESEGISVHAALQTKEEPVFNLMKPRSRCGDCGYQIGVFENIPVLSYLFLKGKCSTCKTPISLRYPVIEIFTGICFAYCGYRWGLDFPAIAWVGFSAALISLIMIDWDTTLLPDDITLPLLWAGLLASLLSLSGTTLYSATLGAVVGYLSLWSVYWLFKLITGKEGMGYGDFKLLAALGAWLGVEAILPILIGSSIIGVLIGILLKINKNLREGGYMPYGPFLGGAGMLIAVTGTEWFYRLILP